jgi:hypothetical protein
MYSLPTEPGSIGNTLDAGFKLYAISFKRVLGMAILSILSVAVPVVAIVFAIATFSGAGQEPDAAIFIVAGVGGLVALTFYLWFYLAAICRIGGIAYGQDLAFGACMSMSGRRLLAVIAGWFLYSLAMMGGFVLFIIPGIFLSVSLSMFTLCIILEGDGIIESMRHSFRLIWGNWWRTAIVGSVVLIIYYVISIAIEIPFYVINAVVFETALGEQAGLAETLLSMVGSFLSAIVTFPLMIAAIIALFHDLKLRKEGHDLEARVEALAASA